MSVARDCVIFVVFLWLVFPKDSRLGRLSVVLVRLSDPDNRSVAELSIFQ